MKSITIKDEISGKYIRYEHYVSLFPHSRLHKDQVKIEDHPISAGMFTIVQTKDGIIVQTYGESLSLNLHSKEDDSEAISGSFVPYF